MFELFVLSQNLQPTIEPPIVQIFMLAERSWLFHFIVSTLIEMERICNLHPFKVFVVVVLFVFLPQTLDVLHGCSRCAGLGYFCLSSPIMSTERATLVLTGCEWISELAEPCWKETSKTERIPALCGASVNEFSHHGSHSALHTSLSGYFHCFYSSVCIILVVWHTVKYS